MVIERHQSNNRIVNTPKRDDRQLGVELENAAQNVRARLTSLTDGEVEELALVLNRLVSKLKPDQVYLFGSHAREDATPDSDIDLLIVVPESDKPGYRLAQEAYKAAAPYAISLDILVMHKPEFERRGRAYASLPATVLREGRVLYAV